MEITLAKALKKKNVLVRELTALNNRFLSNNSYIKNNKPKYDVVEVLEEINEKREELMKLKHAIQIANIGILDKLILIGELKGYVTVLNSLPTQEGEVVSFHQTANTTYECVINQKEKDNLIAESQEKIDELQDEIDAYNATTKIKI